MPYQDSAKSRSGGSSSRTTAPPQNQGVIIGAAIAVLILVVAVIAWKTISSHGGPAPADASHRIVIQHDPESPNDIPAPGH